MGDGAGAGLGGVVRGVGVGPGVGVGSEATGGGDELVTGEDESLQLVIGNPMATAAAMDDAIEQYGRTDMTSSSRSDKMPEPPEHSLHASCRN
jgi:hypothetical protein